MVLFRASRAEDVSRCFETAGSVSLRSSESPEHYPWSMMTQDLMAQSAPRADWPELQDTLTGNSCPRPELLTTPIIAEEEEHERRQRAPCS